MSKSSIPQSSKRAAIYVRVSTEEQAEKISPDAQRQDCCALAEQQGYSIVDIYVDAEKYRVGKKLVEPSGERADRPQFKRMLADARARQFDVIIAWKQDRLIRGLRPLVLVVDLLEETNIGIELVKETFDKRTMLLQAVVAKMELDNIRERTAMGMIARHKAGKITLCNPPYGYTYADGNLYVHEIEAVWVRQIWQWFGEGVGRKGIRQRLIAARAPQSVTGANRGAQGRKHLWSLATLDKILGRDTYATGVFTQTFDNVVYSFPVPPIVDQETFEAVKARRVIARQYADNGRWQHKTLLNGYIHCAACGTKLAGITKRTPTKIFRYYDCAARRRGEAVNGCCRSVRCEVADEKIWAKLWKKVTQEGEMEEDILALVPQLQSEEEDRIEKRARLTAQIAGLAARRDEEIELRHDGIISKEDLKRRLAVLDNLAIELNNELLLTTALEDGQAQRLIELAAHIRTMLLTAMAAIDAMPAGEEKDARLFDFQRWLVEATDAQVATHVDKSFSIALGYNAERLLALPFDHTSPCPNMTDRQMQFVIALTV